MSLVFAALLPHPPLLLPNIGREHAKKLDKTKRAFERASALIATVAPETIVIISPHQYSSSHSFVINFSPEYETHFLEFGDFSSVQTFACDSSLIQDIRRDAEKSGADIALINEKHLDHGCGVPLSALKIAPGTKIVPLSPTMGAGKDQFAFGQALKEAILRSKQKIAVICSADLSHRHTSDSPSGFSPLAQEFDRMMVENLGAGSASPILQMDDKTINEAHACGYRPACIMLGLLDHLNCRPELLAYEIPFGVGYASLIFNLE